MRQSVYERSQTVRSAESNRCLFKKKQKKNPHFDTYPISYFIHAQIVLFRTHPFFLSKRHLSFIFILLPKTSPGQFIFLDLTSETEKPLVDWLIIFANLDQVPGCSLLDFVPEIKEPLVDWLRFLPLLS